MGEVGVGEMPLTADVGFVSKESQPLVEGNLKNRYKEVTELNTAEEIKRINSISTFSNEDAALGLVENSWSKIEESFQNKEEYPDEKARFFAAKIKNNFPGQHRVRYVLWKDPNTNADIPALARRRKLNAYGKETIITDIVELPSDKKEVSARFLARVAISNDKVINLFDFVKEESRDKTYLKFGRFLPQIPDYISWIGNIPYKEGSKFGFSDDTMTIDEQDVKRRYKSRGEKLDKLDANEMTFGHESGHSNQDPLKNFVEKLEESNIQRWSGEEAKSVWDAVDQYHERNAWYYSMLTTRKCAQLGVPIISDNTSSDEKREIAEHALTSYGLDNESLHSSAKKQNFGKEVKSFFKSAFDIVFQMY